MPVTLPSVKALLAYGLADTPADARKLRETMRHPSKGLPPKTAAWAGACYHPPTTGDLRLRIADELTGGFGVETLYDTRGRWVCDYVNHGDTYTPTIVRTAPNHYRVACWGDVVEAAERRGIRFA